LIIIDVIKGIYRTGTHRYSIDKNISDTVPVIRNYGKDLGTVQYDKNLIRRDDRSSRSGTRTDHIITIGSYRTNDYHGKYESEYEDLQLGGRHGRYVNRLLPAVRQYYQESRTLGTFCKFDEIAIMKDGRLALLQLGIVEE
jgi:hypothetical protein